MQHVLKFFLEHAQFPLWLHHAIQQQISQRWPAKPPSLAVPVRSAMMSEPALRTNVRLLFQQLDENTCMLTHNDSTIDSITCYMFVICSAMHMHGFTSCHVMSCDVLYLFHDFHFFHLFSIPRFCSS